MAVRVQFVDKISDFTSLGIPISYISNSNSSSCNILSNLSNVVLLQVKQDALGDSRMLDSM